MHFTALLGALVRDYGLESQVWDEPGGCEHEWGNEQITQHPNSSSGVGKQTTNVGSIGANGERTTNQGQFCQLCNAWQGSLGLEPDPDLYIQHIIQVFREIWRVLRKDGTCWLNLGSSYFGGKGQSSQAWSTTNQDRETLQKSQHQISGMNETRPADNNQANDMMQLRDDLTPEDIAYVLYELSKTFTILEETQDG